MLCEKCSNDTFRVTDVIRERRYSHEKKEWLYDARCDTRRLLCRKCGTIILTESKAIAIEVFDENEFKKKIKEISPRSKDQTRLFGD